MEKRWRKITIVIAFDSEKKEQKTLTNFLNSNKIGPGEMIVLRKEFFKFLPEGQLVLDVMLYDIKASVIPVRVVLSGF